MIYTILLLLLAVGGWIGWLLWVASGELPKGERLERCKQSPQWSDSCFVNALPTPQLTGNDGFAKTIWKFLTSSDEALTPDGAVPAVKINLRALPREREAVVWLGHSGVYIQTGGMRILFDPVLTSRMPVSLFMRPFKGSGVYSPDDIPDIDLLVITHDHWDHLDYATVKSLEPRVARVACSLGVGQHFEFWGYPAGKITDMDWGDSLRLSEAVTLRCLPSRHFSGRLLGRNRTLWASYLIDGPRRIYVSGDGGYDGRFKDIGARYPDIDLAIMENGQYNTAWRHIHTLPSELPQAIDDLSPRRVMTYHNSRYALAHHPWKEPMERVYEHSRGRAWTLLTPRIGEVVDLGWEQSFGPWWRDVK